MPEAFARSGVDGDDAVGEEILAEMGVAGEIGFGRSAVVVGAAPLFIEGDTAPTVGAFLGVFPGVTAGFAVGGDGVKGPAVGTGDGIKAPDVALISSGNEGVLVDRGGDD